MPFVFTKEAVKHFGNMYLAEARPMHGEAARGGCMRAVYIGLESLFGERYKLRGEFHRKFFRWTRKKEKEKGVKEGRFNTIDRVFRALENEGVAFEEQKFKPINGRWELSNGMIIDNMENYLHDQIDGLINGSYYFGVALSGAIHSIILRLDNIPGSKKTFWMDQFSAGYDHCRSRSFVGHPEVTGDLDRIIRDNDSFKKHKTSVWELDPSAARGVFIPADVTGDGVPDASLPAVEEIEII